jgi:methyl-accepting chemotaxis protein
MRKKILAAIVGITIFTCMILSVKEYFVEREMLAQQLIEKGMLKSKSFVQAAMDAVSGGNVMLLENQDAVRKYQTYPDLLYLKVKGTSDGMEASAFSEAIPPVPVDASYINSSIPPETQEDLANQKSARAETVEDGSFLDGDFLHIKMSLTTRNGGYLYAIYDVSELARVGAAIVQRNAILNLIVILVGGAIGFWITGQLASTVTNEIGHLGKNAEKTKKASHMLSASAESISSFFAGQVRSMNDMTSSMNDIETTAQKTMAQAKECFDAVSKARTDSNSGLHELEAMLAAIAEISKSSAELRGFRDSINLIRQKTGVINDIVFKTQLLSFNASIESSRAGQHGRGFAVVAGEVGQLAQMSGSAAGSINEIIEKTDKQVQRVIEDIEARVKRGEEVARRTKGAFDAINKEIGVAGTEVSKTQAAVADQVKLIKVVTQAVSGILAQLKEQQDKVKTNAKIANEIDTLSSELYGLGIKLRRVISAGGENPTVEKLDAEEEVFDSLLSERKVA